MSADKHFEDDKDLNKIKYFEKIRKYDKYTEKAHKNKSKFKRKDKHKVRLENLDIDTLREYDED